MAAKKKALTHLLFMILFLAVLFQGSCLAQSPIFDSVKKIRVSSDHDYPPYEFNDEKGIPTGFNVELINAVAEATDFHTDVRLGVWNEVRAALEAGKIDAIAGMYYSKARERVVDFSVPHNMVSSALFVRESSGIKTLAQLRDKEIIVQRGDIMHDYLVEQGFTVNIIVVDNPIQGLQLIAAGEHDGVLLSSKIQGMYFIKKHRIRDIRVVETYLPARKYCFAVKKGNAELLQKLNEGLNILKHTGKYQQIYEKWFGIYEEKTLWQQSQVFIIALIIALLLLLTISFITWILRLQVKKRTRELLSSEERLRTLVQTIPDLVWLKDADGVYLSCNRAFELFFGARKADIVGKTDYDFVNKELADFFREHDRKAIELGKSSSNEEWVNFASDGRSVLLDTIKTPMYDAGGKLIGVLGIGRNITERKLAKDALEESRREMETLLSNLPGMAYRCRNDREWTMVFVSEGCYDLTGYTTDDLMNNRRISYNEIIHPEDREAVWDQVQEALQKQAHFQLNYRIITAEGEVRWVWEQGIGVHSPTGELVSLEGFITDNTERRKAEEILRLNFERSVTLLKLNQMADTALQVIMNFGFEEAVRLTKSKIGYLGLMNADETVMNVRVWSRSVMAECSVADSTLPFPLANAGLWAEVVRQRRPIITNDYSAPNPWKKGCPEGHIKITRHMSVPIFVGQRITLIAGVGNKEEVYNDNDVQQLTLLMEGLWRLIERKQAEEDRKKLENRLIQAQKMEAIGTLAGGIAHDFNNILSVIIGYTELYKDAVRDQPKVHSAMEQVLKAANRAKDLVMQILAFSRKTEYEKKPIVLSPIVKEAVKFMRASLPTTIEIKQTIDVTSDVIMADPTQIHQVLMNLCTNAGHAMKETGGVLEIGLKEAVKDADNLLHHPVLKTGRYLELFVQDTGHGIAQENLEKIFEPYFTTKEKGEGTGLGLAVVHGIIKDHGGEVSAYSEVGKGSLFRVYLPLLERQEEYIKDKEEITLPGQGETILFVDDEQMIVDASKQVLEQLGYRVVAETDPVRAIEAFRKDHDAFDLVITDKTMPHMTGYDLVQKIRNIRADIPVILCSGFLEKEDLEKITTLGIIQLVTKPVRNILLAKAIRNALVKKQA